MLVRLTRQGVIGIATLTLLALVCNPRMTPAAEFCLVRDGKPAATIVTAAKPVAAVAFAASELQYHIHKITGAVLPVVADNVPVKGVRILVGQSAATRKLGLDGSQFGEQEYLIRFQDNTLILMGRDGPEPTEWGIACRGNPKATEGKFGRALDFNGKDTAVTVTDSGFRDEQGTLEAWVRLPAEPQPGENTILRLDGSAPWTYHIVRRVPKSSRINYITYYGSGSNNVTSGELSPGWHHLMAIYNAADNRQELFVDGISQGTANYTKTTCRGTPLYVGGIAKASQQTVGNPFRGSIDEVRVSSIRRTPESSGFRSPLKPDVHTTLLLHFDEAQGPPKDARGIVSRPAPPQWDAKQGTSYAVHDFLERFCDVRWYGPTELEMVLPEKTTLTVAARQIRRTPALKLRSGPPRQPIGIGRALWNRASQPQLALFWARLKGGGERYACNHSFYGYYDRFWKKNPKQPDLFEASHPDWFAQGYEGKPPQMCYSNEGFIKQVVQDARDYFDGRGLKPGARASGDFFALVPMDNNRQCKCPKCQARMNQDEKDNPQFNNGRSSELIFGFVNKVAREVGKTHPGKYLSAIAYHDYAYYPRNMVLEPNISVQMCLTVRHWWAPCMKENDQTMYREWVDKEVGKRPLYLWLYYCFPDLMCRSGKWHCFPGFSAHNHDLQIKMFAADGIRGASTGGGRAEQVDMYITLKLMDDPSLDVNELLDEFFTRYYGAAAEPMKRIYLLIERTYSTPANYPENVRKEVGIWHQTEEIAWKYLGTEERMAELARLMDQARKAAATGVEKQRVALFDQGVWEYMAEGRRRWLAEQKK